MAISVSQALIDFTRRYEAFCLQSEGRGPASSEHLGIPSPCIIEQDENQVSWRAVACPDGLSLDGVERALSIALDPQIVAFYTTQFAGDMPAEFGELHLSLIQAWSEEDFIRLQENLIGHLVTQKRLKLSPTLFIGTTQDELQLVSLCNVTGRVLLEQFGSQRSQVLEQSLSQFLSRLQPIKA